MINLLINNIRFVNPTSLIRALRKITKYEIIIWGTDTEAEGISSSSVFVDHYIQVPSIECENEYIEFMTKFCIDNKIDIIIPGSDKDVQLYGKYRHLFKATIVLPEEKAIKLFVDKYESTVQLQKLGFLTPPIVNNIFVEKEVIFRKKISSSSNGIEIIDLSTAKQIPNLFNDNYFLQRFIKGDEYTVDIFADRKGKPVLIIPRKRLKIKNGMSVCSQLCCHEKIIDICKQLYNNFFIPGLSNVQFIDDGLNIYFIEMNMRFAGSAISGIAASFNYIEQYLEHFLYAAPLDSFEYSMDKVAWSSIVSRYYDETIYGSNDSKSSKS